MGEDITESFGTVRPDGTLELDRKLNLPPGRVRVSVEAVPPAESLLATEVDPVASGHLPQDGPARDIERRFQDLHRQWKEATLFSSSITEIATHSAYQQIIGMGREALPFIIQELHREPDHWFWALRAITGEDPVLQADRGKTPRMAAAWLNWARDHGYLRAVGERERLVQEEALGEGGRCEDAGAVIVFEDPLGLRIAGGLASVIDDELDVPGNAEAVEKGERVEIAIRHAARHIADVLPQDSGTSGGEAVHGGESAAALASVDDKRRERTQEAQV
jgi:hypothetical protein